MSMGMKNKQRVAINTPIRSMYAADLFLMMGLFNLNLSLRIGRYDNKSYQYDNANAQTLTINYEGASFFYTVAMSILDGTNTEKELQAVYRRGDSTLILDYKRVENSPNNMMIANLILEKNGRSNSFDFSIHPYKVKQDGQIVTKFIQSGLGVFTKAIEGYLIGIGVDRHLSKMPDNTDEDQEQYQQASYSTGNSNGYQNGRY